jgi:hypothetical protein
MMHDVGVHEAPAPEHRDPDEQQHPVEAEHQQQRDPHDHRHQAEQLHHEDLVDVEVRRVARVHELLGDLLAVPRGGEPVRRARQALEQRREHALADRRQHLLVAHVLDLVALEPPQRLSYFRLLRRRLHQHVGERTHSEGEHDRDHDRRHVTPRSSGAS